MQNYLESLDTPTLKRLFKELEKHGDGLTSHYEGYARGILEELGVPGTALNLSLLYYNTAVWLVKKEQND